MVNKIEEMQVELTKEEAAAFEAFIAEAEAATQASIVAVEELKKTDNFDQSDWD
jgi:hypothetical protein